MFITLMFDGLRSISVARIPQLSNQTCTKYIAGIYSGSNVIYHYCSVVYHEVGDRYKQEDLMQKHQLILNKFTLNYIFYVY